MQAAQSLLDWQHLYTWAEQKEPGAILGESCTNSSCPLAEYLREQTGIYWSVGPSIRPADGTKRNRLDKPLWVKAMIEHTDQATGNQKGPVTREQLLEVLEQVKDLQEPPDDYQRGRQDAEREVIEALRAVNPLAIVIMPASSGYAWQWYDNAGTAPDLATAIKHALDSAMMTLLSMDPQRQPIQHTPADQVNPNFGRPDWFYHPSGKEE
jgi:hypothetical protein